ncbi:MAG: GGDEF domain-containing protein [Acidobacteria bacterium]|nr:GGDEF domain-containing protein [Acidobacteriota bacterium]MCA1632851.1 GGDEF domain-containing protein [Acidobacteriota bacterium]MCA1640987.1 GGDEF domain-containing protein [Acidobacteriota bacterium]
MSLDDAIGQLEKLVAEIRRVSSIDDKTSLGNALSLSQEERLINQGASEFDVVVFGDLNDFKHLNDKYGHDAGNVAINKVGDIIHKIVVEDLQSKAFRHGGDEFVILLRQDAVERFLALTSAFGDIFFSHKEEELRTAMSLGYALSDGKSSFGELLGRAEVACQHAKALGDGVCTQWTEDIKLNPFVRISGRCQKCGARISCNVPQQNAPTELICCPCCGESL